MMIEALMGLVLLLLRALLAPIQILSVPAGVAIVFANLTEYLIRGAQIVAAYTHFTYIGTLFGIVLLIIAFDKGYHLIFWVLRKIPFLNIRE